MRELRSAVESVACLLEQEQMLPGDFVGFRGLSAAGTGNVMRVLPPEAGGGTVIPGKLTLRTPKGSIVYYDENELEKVDPSLVSPQIADMFGEEGTSLEMEFLASLNTDITEEFGVCPLKKPTDRADRPKDPDKSMAAKVAQRDPLTKQKKRIAMRRNWRRAKSRSAGGGQLGNEPSALRPFESMIEQAMEDETVPGEVPMAAGAETKFRGPVTPEEARIQTERVYNALSDMMKALALAEGTVYFHSVQDDPDRGILRLKLNGQAPKDIVERFTSTVEELDIRLLEKPEGTDDDDTNVHGWWIFEMAIPDFKSMAEEEIVGQEPMVPTTQGDAPGEIRIPIGDEE